MGTRSERMQDPDGGARPERRAAQMGHKDDGMSLGASPIRAPRGPASRQHEQVFPTQRKTPQTERHATNFGGVGHQKNSEAGSWGGRSVRPEGPATEERVDVLRAPLT